MYVRRKSIQDNQLPRHLQIAATGEIEIGEKIHVDCGFWILDGEEHDDCDEFAKELDSVVCCTFWQF